MKILRRTYFGNPVLRAEAKLLTKAEISTPEVQQLIGDLQHTLKNRAYGVGLAAPQVGSSIALSVIGIKPTPTRKDLKPFELVIINPVIVRTYGNRTGMWEGCISGTELYAKAMRYKKIRMRWLDENALEHEQDFSGFVAHVLQHEVDHLHGILFVDKVKDTKTYMTFGEYNRRVKSGSL
ncbi:MAG: peptide deformylase [Candidatus Saccharimonadales bacterium]